MIVEIIVISVIGTFLHFAYEIFKNKKIIGVFAAVNESSWEHIKMAITPTFLYSFIDGFLYGSNPNYFLAKAISVIALIIVIPILFYSEVAILKRCVLVLDILEFYIAIIVSQLSFYWILEQNPIPEIGVYFSVILLFAVFGFYLLSTFMPMRNFLFLDPITLNYGFVDVKHFKMAHGVDSEIRSIHPLIITDDAEKDLEMLSENGFQQIHVLNDMLNGEGKDHMLVNVNGCHVDVLETSMLQGKESNHAVKIYSKNLDATYERFMKEKCEVVVDKSTVKSTKLALLKDQNDRYILITEHVKK